MKFHPTFKNKLDCQTSDDVFEYLISTWKESILKWDYFVNWNKVNHNVRDIEISLNLLNYLIGKENIEIETKILFQEHPKLVSIVPALVACRKKKFLILTSYHSGKFEYDNFIFKKAKDVTDTDIDKAIIFLKKSGFLEQITRKNIKSLTDYFFGVEVGLDSNGRKNRSGKSMEEIVEYFVNSICAFHKLEYLSQATAGKIKSQFDKNITVNKASKIIDFAINTPNKLILIETNFYGGGGSKLKSTAGEYSNIFLQWQKDGHDFIWITDGIGWSTSQAALHDTFDKIDYILNLEMVQKGILEELILD